MAITGPFRNFVATSILFIFVFFLKSSNASARKSSTNTWMSLKRFGKCSERNDNLPVNIETEILKLNASAYLFNITINIEMDPPPDLKNFHYELSVYLCTDTNFQKSHCSMMFKQSVDKLCEYMKNPNTYYALFYNNSKRRLMCPIKRGSYRYENLKLEVGLLKITSSMLSANFLVYVKIYDPVKKLIGCSEGHIMMKPQNSRTRSKSNFLNVAVSNSK